MPMKYPEGIPTRPFLYKVEYKMMNYYLNDEN